MKTLNELANFINESEDYPLETINIIEKNKWVALTTPDYNICLDTKNNELLYFTESGVCEVKSVTEKESVEILAIQLASEVESINN